MLFSLVCWLQLTGVIFVCSAHFRSGDYRKLYNKFLKPRAVSSVFKWIAEKKTGNLPAQRNLPFATGCAARLASMATVIPAAHHRDVLGSNIDEGKRSRQTSWLYQCMIYKCSCTFERLSDLRRHFVHSHQSGNQFHAFCLLVFSQVGR